MEDLVLGLCFGCGVGFGLWLLFALVVGCVTVFDALVA